MNQAGRRMQWMIWVGLGITVILLLMSFLLVGLGRVPSAGRLPIYGMVADFTLTNQFGKPIGLGDLKGKVWIADIIFTRCAGPCPIMTRNMKSLQDQLAGTGVRFVTLTTDPEYDTPEVLSRYADRFKADPARWLFLTGSKKQIALLAVDSLKFTSLEKKPAERTAPEDLFIHSTIFILVDKQARVRGIFETTGEGVNTAEALRRLGEGARKLERER